MRNILILFLFLFLFYGCSDINSVWISYYQADVNHVVMVLDNNGNLIVEKYVEDVTGTISWSSKIIGYINITLDEKYEVIQIVSPSYNFKQVIVTDGMTITR